MTAGLGETSERARSARVQRRAKLIAKRAYWVIWQRGTPRTLLVASYKTLRRKFYTEPLATAIWDAMHAMNTTEPKQ
jgi:hypothetical protein